MKKILINVNDLRTTIPGAVIIVVAVVAFFSKAITWEAFTAGVSVGAGLLFVNSKKST